MSLRLAHFSDIHLTATPVRLAALDWMSKRSVGWLNGRFGRGKHFVDATAIASAMAQELRGRGHDHVIFSGDATALGLRVEYDEVRRVLKPDEGWPAAIAVPGNHDYYVGRSARRKVFESVFASWQQGERIGDFTYPFAQRVGPIWLIGVNSAGPNVAFWDARGRVGRGQRARLAELLKRLPPGPRIIVTHYPLRLEDGRPETRWRKLRDARPVLDIARAADVRLWVHGHRHGSYVRPPGDGIPFPLICAGSATQAGLWSYNEYTFADGLLHGRRRFWSAADGRFVDGAAFVLKFPLS